MKLAVIALFVLLAGCAGIPEYSDGEINPDFCRARAGTHHYECYGYDN